MPFKKGQSGNPAGKKKGTKNKRTDLLEMIQADYPNYHPIKSLAQIANDEKIELNFRLQAHKEICKYITPQLKAVDVSLPDQEITFRIVEDDGN